ncbi:hypothetical protein HJC23_008543 [Cyclotella cryptica]|uniref:Uncharacterized protein n=1 Tax=Cyclotella cryptica TaxID=29204 RepID=A0ABD3QX18_9STRA
MINDRYSGVCIRETTTGSQQGDGNVIWLYNATPNVTAATTVRWRQLDRREELLHGPRYTPRPNETTSPGYSAARIDRTHANNTKAAITKPCFLTASMRWGVCENRHVHTRRWTFRHQAHHVHSSSSRVTARLAATDAHALTNNSTSHVTGISRDSRHRPASQRQHFPGRAPSQMSSSQQGEQPAPRPLQMGAKGAYIVRLLMVGDSSCGKTSLVLRFDQNVFSTKFVTTIGVDYRDKMVKIEGAPMRLQLWDTAGQERFRSLTSNFFGRADGFVLCYDISNRPSFDHVIGWMRDIKTRAPPDCDIVLCGNKSDLEGDRVVQTSEGKSLAEEYGVQFFETSALTGANVETMFNALATTIKRRRIDEYEGSQGASVAGGQGSVGVGSVGGGTAQTVNLGRAVDAGGGGGGAGRSCC